jgi:signal transduction histidine kinase/HAMP domain-containing protein
MSRIGKLQPAAQIDETTLIRKAFRIAAILLGATVIVEIAILSGAILYNAWQMYVLAAIVFAFGIIVAISLVAIQRGATKLGLWLIIGGLFVIFPAASALITNLGLLLAIISVFLIGVIGTQILPARPALWTLIAAFGAGNIIFILDDLNLNYRWLFPELQTLTLVVAVILAIISAFLIARHYTDYSLRVKFVIIFLVLSLFSVGVVAIVANNSIRTNLTQTAGDNLNNLAELQSLSIGELLGRQIDILESLSINSQSWGRFRTANAKYGIDPDQIQTALDDIEQRWDTLPDEDSLVFDTLLNIAAVELQALRKRHPAHVQIFVTDIHGGVLAATNRTADYFHADEEWWQHAYNNGQGAVHISQPILNHSSGSLELAIAQPIYDPDQNVIGIVHSIYELTEIKRLIQAGGNESQSIYAELLLANNQILGVDDAEPVLLDPETLVQLEASATEFYGEFGFVGSPSFVSQAAVIDFSDEPAIANLGWTYITHQQREAALAVVETQVRSVFGWGVLVAIIAVIVAVFAAQRLADPISRLTAIAQQMTSGDLSVQASVESGDEVGYLAQSFNTMATQLRGTIETLEDQVRDRTQHLETVAILSGHINAVLDTKQLLNELTNRVKEDFDYYHAHIYLLDETSQDLELAEGAGAPGAKMKAAGHRIALAAPTSLVARAARSREVVWVDDVQDVADWLPNPLLPDTRSEMAVPVIREGEVLGVLDVQADIISGLDEGDAQVLRTLAGHIAVALSNARLFEQTQEAKEVAETSRVEAELANYAKSSFLSNMSHELRTPLNAIINFVEMIALGMAGPINAEQKDLLNQSVNSSTHLLSLINDVLDISKIQSGHLKLFVERDVDLYVELATAIEMAKPLINEKPIQMIEDIDDNLPIIAGDKRRIRQVFLNLLTNAIKFTPEGSITVSAKCQVDHVTFAVIDTGPGIKKDAQSVIFEPFVQTADGIKLEQGTGLGLSISYSLAQSHGGDLWVESEPGQGATFYFTLPTNEYLKNNGE